MSHVRTSLAHRAPSSFTDDQLRARARAMQARAHRDGLLVVAYDDDRLTWPERELVRQLGEKLNGGEG